MLLNILSDAAILKDSHFEFHILSIQILRWIHEETLSLSHDHTDVGDSLSTAELSKQSFEDYQTKMAVSIWKAGREGQEGGRERRERREKGEKRERAGWGRGGERGGRGGPMSVTYM